MSRRTPSEHTRLAGEVRTEVNRLAYHLRTPATRSGITPTRLAALAALARFPDGVRQGDLAELMNVSAPSMTRLVEIMSDAGWIERRRDPHDQRCLLLALSPVGVKTLDTLRDESATQLSEELDDLTPEERAALAAAVPVLRKLADRHLDG
ncbi:MAG: MarR family transcriptional regulator [Nocardioides sp.]|nr:MarR family transcriptional regulator [Nocardioides sp.]